jgi:hypothetical protein
MHRAYALVSAVFLALSIPAHQVFAQGMKELVGTWTAVSNENTLPDGQKMHPFGSKPVGILMFDADGTTPCRFADRIVPISHQTIGCKALQTSTKLRSMVAIRIGADTRLRGITSSLRSSMRRFRIGKVSSRNGPSRSKAMS